MKTKTYHRRSIRLNGYDYAQNGNYFLTLCTRNRECLFGDVRDGKMYLSNYGKMVNECWQEIPVHFPQIVLHEYVIMPNHVHGIIEINNPQSTGANTGMCTDIVTIGANVGDVGANAVDDVAPTDPAIPSPWHIPNGGFRGARIQNRGDQTNGIFPVATQLLRTHHPK